MSALAEYGQPMHNAYARCMDGHFFLVGESAHCPFDGSRSDAASAVLSSGVTGENLTLASLSQAGIAARVLADILLAEQVDGADLAEMLEPR